MAKFKVGDKVKVLFENSMFYQMIGTISAYVPQGKFQYQFQLPGEEATYYFHEHELELELVDQPLKVGDKIRLKADEAYGDTTKGKVYTITGLYYEGKYFMVKYVGDRGVEVIAFTYRFELVPDVDAKDARIAELEGLLTIEQELVSSQQASLAQASRDSAMQNRIILRLEDKVIGLQNQREEMQDTLNAICGLASGNKE